MGNISYRLSLKTISLFAVSCSGIGFFSSSLFYLLLCLTFNYTILFYLYTISYVLSCRIVFFFTEEQERVQKKTFTNWINSYLSKVSFLSSQCYSIYPTIYLSIYLSDFNRFTIEICISRRETFIFFLRWVLLIDPEVDILYIANILNMPNLMELFISKSILVYVRERERDLWSDILWFDESLSTAK